MLNPTKGYELIIKSVVDSDGGTYTCIATNDAGTTSEEIGLCLNHKHHYLIVSTKIRHSKTTSFKLILVKMYQKHRCSVT